MKNKIVTGTLIVSGVIAGIVLGRKVITKIRTRNEITKTSAN